MSIQRITNSAYAIVDMSNRNRNIVSCRNIIQIIATIASLFLIAMGINYFSRASSDNPQNYLFAERCFMFAMPLLITNGMTFHLRIIEGDLSTITIESSTEKLDPK